MVSLKKKDDLVAAAFPAKRELPSCTPEHLLTEEQTIAVARMPQMLQVTVQKNMPLAKSQAGVLTQINQKEKVQEKLDAFLMQSEVFALRQDLRFKHDKKDVVIEQGARIKIHDAELSEDGKSVKLDLCSVTKDDWDKADYYFCKHTFRYSELRFGIDSLDKYFEPDFEVTRLMKCVVVFKYLFGANAFISALLGLIILLCCIVGCRAGHEILFAVITSICSIAVGLSAIFGMLSIRTRNIIYGELRNVENEILQRARFFYE